MYSEILDSAWSATCALANDCIVKIIASGIFLLLARHFAIFTLFAIVVFIDLFAKFIALSHKMKIEDGDTDASLMAAIHGIPEAHRRGIINSWEMKMQFCGKMFLYSLLVIATGAADTMVHLMQGKSEFCMLTISYLAATELLSIVENLDEAGVSAVHELVVVIKRKRGV